jgi:hypothetical protein
MRPRSHERSYVFSVWFETNTPASSTPATCGHSNVFFSVRVPNRSRHAARSAREMPRSFLCDSYYYLETSRRKNKILLVNETANAFATEWEPRTKTPEFLTTNGHEKTRSRSNALHSCALVSVCVQSDETCVKQGGVRKLGSNSWVNECEHHKWLRETLENEPGVTLRISD